MMRFENEFSIVEYVHLGLNDNYKYYPLEETKIAFKDNGSYTLDTELLFEAPQFNKRTLYHIFNANNALIAKLEKGIPLRPRDEKDLQHLPATYLICYLNDFQDAREKLQQAKPYLKQIGGSVYQSYKESVRILRKVKYN